MATARVTADGKRANILDAKLGKKSDWCRSRHKISDDTNLSISANPEIMEAMDKLLTSFVEQQRMKLPGTEYVPCYRNIK